MSIHFATREMDQEHSLAICEEIGERLRIALGASEPIPPHLATLVQRLDEIELHASPSIVPAMEPVALTLEDA